jgi:hypothetical protein
VPRESAVERYLVMEVAKAGGTAEKFISAGRRDVPDRIVTWTSPLLDFVELKAPGEKPTPGQLRDHARRRARGYSVLVIDSKDGVDLYVKARALFGTSLVHRAPSCTNSALSIPGHKAA